MKLLVTALTAQPAGREPSAAHADAVDDADGADHAHHGAGHGHGDSGGIEWEDDMVAVNRLTTPANMRWKLVDRITGAANAAIDWQFTAGERVKIRLVNEMDSDMDGDDVRASMTAVAQIRLLCCLVAMTGELARTLGPPGKRA